MRFSGGPAPWQWAVLGTVALVAVLWLVAAAARTLRRLRSRSPSVERARTRGWTRCAAVVATVTVLLSLGSVALVAWTPGLVDSGFLGWLDLPLVQRLSLHLPLALAALGACAFVLAAFGWAGRWWSRAVGLQYAALAVAVVALVAQLAAWRLIGWGLS